MPDVETRLFLLLEKETAQQTAEVNSRQVTVESLRQTLAEAEAALAKAQGDLDELQTAVGKISKKALP